MASPQPTQEQPPKVYLRNDVYRSAVPDMPYTTPYGKAPVAYKAGDTVVYSRQPATVPRQAYPSMDSIEAPYYVDESTLRSGTFSDLSNQSKSKHSKSSQRLHHRYHHHHHRGQRIEDPDGYWKVPHANSQEKLHSTLPGSYVTPGGRQLPRTPKQHTAGVQVIDVNQTVGEKPEKNPSYTDLTQEAEEYMQSSQYLPSEDSEMTITFHYDPNADAEMGFPEDTLVRLQAQCRAFLAKKRFREDEAVRIIQKNAALYFDPWFRLFLVLKPHLKHFRLEEEIIQLKSELEKYKAMVNVLRYENVAYQDKISRLLILLDQMHPDGSSSDLISKLIKELSMAVADHQKQWRSMVAELPSSELNGVSGGISAVIGQRNSDSAMTENSYELAKGKAEFYREQLELLRDDVEAQNARISQHYEEKIGVLSERVEQLQDMLTRESFRVERLNGELDVANGQLVEARETEGNLTNMVSRLKAELDRRLPVTASEPGTPGEPAIVANTVQNAYAAAPLPSSIELLNDRQGEQMSALRKLAGIRSFLTENPEIYETLKDTPLGQGGEYDILSPNDGVGSGSLGVDGALGHSTNSIFHSQSHIENYHLGRTQEMDSRYDMLQQKLEDEIGYREDLELEAQEMRNKISNLQRQVRRQRDEHEEEMVEREQAHNRRVRELDDVIDEITKEKQDLEKRCLELQNKVEELRQTPDLSDSENGGDELRDTQAKLAAENRQYQKELDQIREDFEQYKRENNTKELKEQLIEKDEKISQLEVSQRHTSSDMEILNVRLQNANKLLDDNEQRLRSLTKERQGLMHRISQLEGERDAAVREAASVTGKAGAEREASVARLRELEDLKLERAAYQKDFTEMKLHLIETSTKAEAEKHALEKRLSDLETASNKREADLKADLDVYKEKVENLQQELSELHKVESVTSTDNRHLKRRIRELQDNVETYTRRVAELERRNADLSAEVERTQASLSASREAAASLMRDRQTLASEGYDFSATGPGTDTVEYSDDDEVDVSNDIDELVTSPGDLGRHSASYYGGISGTQTVDRCRNRSQQRQSSRSTSRSRTYNRTQPMSHRQSTPASGLSSKDLSPLLPPRPSTRYEEPSQQNERLYDSEN
ncbi:Myosin heavy chain non-muscle [Taenia crassiceps]|uniref:Myosin heavy chain non-muscle n=1 Tax=Taenia crassiceps TaxID=6207 RepID=A0ABR4QIE0_9CEST